MQTIPPPGRLASALVLGTLLSGSAGLLIAASVAADDGCLDFLNDQFTTENGGNGAGSYTGFANWDVTENDVDLYGPGYNDVGAIMTEPFVDLSGNNGPGTMESKTAFAHILGTETWELWFRLSGSRRQGVTAEVTISVGSVFSESFTLGPNAGPTNYTRSFTVTSGSHEVKLDSSGTQFIGLFVDNIALLCTGRSL